MDFEMGEREDFGDWGDERLLEPYGDVSLDEGDSMVDRFELWQEHKRQRELEEIKLEFADEANDEQGHKRDLCDIVREHEEREDWLDEESEDYYDCEWEE